MYQWISWYQPTEDYRPLSYPPNAAIMGWWCSGSAATSSTLCALVLADDEEAAREAVRKDWPEAVEWRFCVTKEAPQLGDRFPFEDWMTARIQQSQQPT